MCGLVGLIGSQGNYGPIASMTASLQSRGPDETSFTQSTWFSLGFCRLSIVGLRDGHQPVSSACGGVSLAFNGEIYNYRSLSSNASEAEALLLGYMEDGPAFVERLDGDFAIFIADSRSRTCYAFRDPAGVKPLYYTSWHGGRVWAVASQVKAFFRHPDFTTGLDCTALAERAVLNFWSRDRTCFDRVHQLPPGCGLKLCVPLESGAAIEAPRVTAFAPYRPPASHSNGAPDFERAVAKCTRLIRGAVGKRIEHSDVDPVVIAWSGGIDSSIIAALASRHYADRVAAITIGDDPLLGALSSTRRLALEIGLRHNCYPIGLREFLDEFASIVVENPGPQPAYSAYFLGRATRHFHSAAKVLLCGEGADELFLGYPLFVSYPVIKARILRALDGLALASLESSPLLERIRNWERQCGCEAWNDFVRIYQDDQLSTNHLLPFDHGPMAHSVECRVPFLDRDLMNYLDMVPLELRIARGIPKIHLRGVLKRVLPAGRANSILGQAKEPAFFSTNLCRAWLREFVEERIGRSALQKSSLRAFARNAADLFWLASIQVVFLKHRGEISGMTFADLADEVLYGTKPE
jgi:asparagine synthase (glutamine-hydrolysing)